MSTKPFVALTHVEIDNFTPSEMIHFCACRLLCRTELAEIKFVPEQIHYMIYNNCNSHINETKRDLRMLADNGYIIKYPNGGYGIKYLDYIPERGEKWTLIYTNELAEIIFSTKKNKEILLLHFIQVIKSLDLRDVAMFDGRRGVVGHISASYFAKIENLHINTILRLNEALEKLGLLYINRAYKFGINCYGRPSDEEYIDFFAQKFNRYTKSTQIKANKQRSAAQKYNHFMEVNGEGYDFADLNDLLNTMEEYNKYAETEKDLSFITSKLEDELLCME